MTDPQVSIMDPSLPLDDASLMLHQTSPPPAPPLPNRQVANAASFMLIENENNLHLKAL